MTVVSIRSELKDGQANQDCWLIGLLVWTVFKCHDLPHSKRIVIRTISYLSRYHAVRDVRLDLK